MGDWNYMVRRLDHRVLSVTGVMKSGDRPGTGTAFHVGDGWLLTAEHVWDDLKDPGLWLYDDDDDDDDAMRRVSVRREVRVHTSDLLLLETDFETAWRAKHPDLAGEPVPVLTPGVPGDYYARAENGLDVLIAGFPRVAWSHRTQLSKEEGRVLTAPYTNSLGSWFAVSTPPRPGYSGGPVINPIGRFIGVVSRDGREDESAPGFTTCGDLRALDALLRARPPQNAPEPIGEQWEWIAQNA